MDTVWFFFSALVSNDRDRVKISDLKLPGPGLKIELLGSP